MPTARLLSVPSWHHLAAQQHGVVSRRQLLALAFTHAQAQQCVSNGRWRALLPGVYITFTGPVSSMALVWAATLYAGNGAAVSHSTALWLAGVLDGLPRPLHISVGHDRRVRQQRGLQIHRMSALDQESEVVLHPTARPPRIRIERAVLDQAALGTDVVAVDLVLRAVQRRLTTAARIRECLSLVARHRWRTLLLEVLSEAAAGVASPLELRYLHHVERPHGLPKGSRNQPEKAPSGSGSWYRDVRYSTWRTVVELDGAQAHPVERSFRDFRRDNHAAIAGDTVLRYGWRDVVANPCEIAAQVQAILQALGWTGSAVACRPGCALGRGGG